jgi:hypothetical protein
MMIRHLVDQGTPHAFERGERARAVCGTFAECWEQTSDPSIVNCYRCAWIQQRRGEAVRAQLMERPADPSFEFGIATARMLAGRG